MDDVEVPYILSCPIAVRSLLDEPHKIDKTWAFGHPWCSNLPSRMDFWIPYTFFKSPFPSHPFSCSFKPRWCHVCRKARQGESQEQHLDDSVCILYILLHVASVQLPHSCNHLDCCSGHIRLYTVSTRTVLAHIASSCNEYSTLTSANNQEPYS